MDRPEKITFGREMGVRGVLNILLLVFGESFRTAVDNCIILINITDAASRRR
jgi:hypothetical protein